MAFIALLIGIVAAYLALVVYVCPKLFFSTRYSVSNSSDRYVKSSDGKNSRDMVFSPSEETSEFISRYALSDRDGKRVLVCKLVKPISKIDYDVVVFDNKDKIKRVFNVKDDVGGAEFTHVVELPFDTEYVSVIVNDADGVCFKHNVIKNASKASVFAYILINTILLAAAVYGIRVCTGFIFGGLYDESFMHVSRSNLASGILAAALALIDMIVIVTAFAVRRRKRRAGVRK